MGNAPSWRGGRRAAAALLLAAISIIGALPPAAAGPTDWLAAPAARPFRAELRLDASDTVAVVFTVAPGNHLYRDQARFEVLAPAGVRPGSFTWAPGIAVFEPGVGTMTLWHGTVRTAIPLLVADAAATTVTVKVTFQGCADAGVCFPPEEAVATLTRAAAAAPAGAAGSALAGAAVAAATAPAAVAPAAAPASGSSVAAFPSETDRVAGVLRGGSLPAILLSFFGFGLLLALTPCVFPMVPILSGIIVGQGGQLSTARAFVLSATYVLAMALTYTVAGVAAGLLGRNLQIALQNPWMLGGMAGLLGLLSLSMFGYFDLALPAAWQQRLAQASRSQQGGTLLGVAIMGVLSALLVGPCVAPPLAGALVYIGQTGDALLGGLALFALALGMGTPLLVVGTLGGKVLPRAGEWMEQVKVVFGVVMLGVAITLLERVLAPGASLPLWALLLAGSAVHLGALEPLPAEGSGLRRLGKALGVLLLVLAATQVVGLALGADDPWRPLAPLAGREGGGGGAAAVAAPVFATVRDDAGLVAALAAARDAGRPAFVDVWAQWCVACKEIDHVTLADPAVRAALAPFALLRADVTANDAAATGLLAARGLAGPPSLLVFDRAGRPLPGTPLVGFVPPAQLLPLLQAAAR